MKTPKGTKAFGVYFQLFSKFSLSKTSFYDSPNKIIFLIFEE